MSARDDLLDEYGRADTAPLGTLADLRKKLDAYRAEVIAEYKAQFTMADARGIARAHRAAVLREAADAIEALPQDYECDPGRGDATDLLRRMVHDTGSVEKDTREGESTPAAVGTCGRALSTGEPCPDHPAQQQPALTVYRASHESIVFGHYTTREAAREHCEAYVRREVGEGVFLGWVPDDGSDDAPEELCTGYDVECTGYVVTPLEVASKYDPEADE